MTIVELFFDLVFAITQLTKLAARSWIPLMCLPATAAPPVTNEDYADLVGSPGITPVFRAFPSS